MRDWRTFGCAALIGAAIAFPAGLVVGGGGTPPGTAPQPSRPAPSSGGVRTARDVYSPRIAGDPYVVEQQRKVLRALERSCSRLRQHCPEAEQARRRIEEAEARR